jgi:DNA-binding beta-propeller fold protein YncE
MEWTIAAAPSGNTNGIEKGADGYTRFTPHATGPHSFTLSGESGTTESLDVIPSDAAPFHNLNYFPGQSIALVNGELWTADVYASTVTRLDPASVAPKGSIDVGPWPVAIAWREGMKYAVVAQRGGDTLGLVDVAAGRIVDAIWVGDEPSNVVLSPDGKIAYATLASENAVVAVDLASRAVLGRVPTGTDPRAMALSKDGSKLFVASYRSGQSERYPHATDPASEQEDITVIDTLALAVADHFLEVGGMIQGLVLSEDGARLYVATTRNNTQANLLNIDEAAFAHFVLALDPATGDELAAADLSRQPSSKGFAATLHGLALANGKLWAVAESSDVVIGLDPMTLEELVRAPTEGRPRALVADGGAVLVHGAQSMKVTRVEDATGKVTLGQTRPDPRPELVARGQRRFTGAGQGYAQNHACNSCHADGLSDRLSWKIGPLDIWEISRPQFWLEGTEVIGWTGYVSSARNFALAGNGTIGDTPDTDEFEGMSAYLNSLMPPPPANGKTKRDGGLSAEAARGKVLYETKGACISCHALPLGTSRQLLDDGITEGKTDVPSLVGVYRHGIWLKHGDARDLRSSVEQVIESLGLPALSAGEIDDLTRYVEELTARDFFLLARWPRESEKAAVDQPIRLSFSYPVFEDAQNLARIRLLDAAGAPVAAKVTAEDRHVVLSPDKPLSPESTYRVVIGGAFESFSEGKLFEETRIDVETAKAPSMALEGSYEWTVSVPIYNPTTGEFDPNTTVPISVYLKAVKGASGATLTFDYGESLLFDASAIVEGNKMALGATPVPVNSNFADTRDIVADITDDDGDGVADRASGTLTLTGPGMYFPLLPFTFSRPKGGECVEGPSGSGTVAVMLGGDGIPVIDWGAEQAIGLYVTSPGAKLPLGPGQTVTNGTAYWVIQTTAFPEGFLGPVAYGILPTGAEDLSAANGAMPGGTPLESGMCYTFSVITTSFAIGGYTLRLP